jgi:integrase
MKLTKANLPLIAAAFADSGKADKIYFDDDLPGFGLRLRAGSKRMVWVCRYEYAGIQRKLTLGTTAILSPEQAREKARREMAKIVLGEDPQATKAEEKARARITLRYVANQYLQRQETELRPKSLRDSKRYLMVSFRSLHHKPIHQIARRDIAVVLNDLAAKAPIAASRSRSVLSAMFSWAKGEGYLDGDNPVEGTNIPAATVVRDRVLSDVELAAVWNSCGNDTYGNILRLLILTGQRREEVGGMVWTELDKPPLWTIPGSRTKNGNEHTLTLAPQAWSIVDGVPRRQGHVFGNGSRGFNNWDREKKALDQRCRIAPWRLHDLRRTVATRMADLGVLPHIVEAVLNHVSGHKAGVAGVYNKSRYEREVKNALAIWADHVASITSGEDRKIIPLKA